MTSSRATIALFALIILEGYVVLSSELLAIRLSLPFVGSGTDTVSIIIAAVLMPLAFGYHTGGNFKPGVQKFPFSTPHYISVREKLIINMLIALGFLLFGLSYGFLDIFFSALVNIGIIDRIAHTAIYATIFLATPVYLLGQTIPLACNFFSREKLAKITGRVLFFSTIGSFLGAVFSTLVLMSHIGVNATAIINFFILGGLITMMSKDKLSTRLALVWALVAAGTLANTEQAMRDLGIVENNQYNTVAVANIEDQRHLFINRNSSSMYSDSGDKHEYAKVIERMMLDALPSDAMPKNILILGAGGFTIGAEDSKNIYDVVDIDESLQDVAEKYILMKPLGDNVTVHTMPARGYLAQTQTAYDVIIVDVFTAATAMPEHLTTKEFFQQIKDALKPDGSVIISMALSPNFSSPISRNIDNTIRAAMPHISRHVIYDDYGLWDKNENHVNNVLYIYKHQQDADTKTIYTDTKNRSFLDRPKSRYSAD